MPCSGLTKRTKFQQSQLLKTRYQGYFVMFYFFVVFLLHLVISRNPIPQDGLQPYWSLAPTVGLPSALNVMTRWFVKQPNHIGLKAAHWTDDNTILLPLRSRLRQHLSDSEVDQVKNLLIENIYVNQEPLAGPKMSENIVLLDGLIRVLPRIEEVANFSLEAGATITGKAFHTMAKAEVFKFFTQSVVPLLRLLRKKYANMDRVHLELDNLTALLEVWLREFEEIIMIKLNESNVHFWFTDNQLVLSVQPTDMHGSEMVTKTTEQKNQQSKS